MNENGKRKREWVKTAAIVFLSVMLVLTFFSNTFMNYSLPEVATQYVQSGTITARIRGTGVIESGDPYEVKVTESRKVSSVAVRVGDEVKEGDVLFYLEDAESEELKAAKDMLEAAEDVLRDARDAYYEALLTGEITAEDIQAANSNTSASAYRQQINDAQAKIAEAENALKPYDDKIAELTQKIADVDAQNEWETSQLNLAQIRVDNAKSGLNSVSGNDSESRKAREALEKATKEYNDINNRINNLNNQRSNYVLELYNSQKAQAAANKNLETAQKELDDLITMLKNKMGLDVYQDAISDAQKEVTKAQERVAEIESKAIGGTITADISGTVIAINVTAGNSTSAAEPVAVLQREGQGYTLSFSVTNDQARRLAVGDRADLVNAWRYDDVNVVLSKIQPDKNNPGQQKLLTFDVTGNVVAGQTLNISVGQQSANFDLIVPNSAIREDNNGKFILIVETRSSPLGNRYVASRVDVEVLASDDTRSAVSGALYGYEYVITTSTKPVEAGQLVRLADN